MLKDSQLFIYFSKICLLHKFQPNKFADIAGQTNANAAIILDRMSTFKMDNEVLISPHFTNQNQPTQLAALLSMVGINTLIINQWAVSENENFKILKTLIEETTEQQYLTANLKDYKAAAKSTEDPSEEKEEGQKDEEEPGLEQPKVPYKKALYRFTTINYGVPLARIV